MEDDDADFIRSHIEFIDMQKDKIVHKDPVDEMEKYYEQYYYGRGSDAWLLQTGNIIVIKNPKEL